MKKFIKNYLNLIAMSITGMVFVFASFYILMNYNHNEELKKNIYIGDNEVNYTAHKEKLNNLNDNLNKIKNKKNVNSKYREIVNGLSECYTVLQSKESFAGIQTNKEYNSYEIHQLGTNFQNNVLNLCWNVGLGTLSNDTKENSLPTTLKNIKPIIEDYISSIEYNLSDSLDEIKNNSSYFYTTSIASATVRNYLGSDYQSIAKSYNDFVNILVRISEIINEDEVSLNG